MNYAKWIGVCGSLQGRLRISTPHSNLLLSANGQIEPIVAAEYFRRSIPHNPPQLRRKREGITFLFDLDRAQNPIRSNDGVLA